MNSSSNATKNAENDERVENEPKSCRSVYVRGVKVMIHHTDGIKIFKNWKLKRLCLVSHINIIRKFQRPARQIARRFSKSVMIWCFVYVCYYKLVPMTCENRTSDSKCSWKINFFDYNKKKKKTIKVLEIKLHIKCRFWLITYLLRGIVRRKELCCPRRRKKIVITLYTCSTQNLKTE